MEYSINAVVEGIESLAQTRVAIRPDVASYPVGRSTCSGAMSSSTGCTGACHWCSPLALATSYATQCTGARHVIHRIV